MRKEYVLWFLVGASITQSFINYFFGFDSWVLFIGLSAFFLGLICITPIKTLEEDIFNETTTQKGRS